MTDQARLEWQEKTARKHYLRLRELDRMPHERSVELTAAYVGASLAQVDQWVRSVIVQRPAYLRPR